MWGEDFMKYRWIDYSSDLSSLVNAWLDNDTVTMTGIYMGWDEYVNASIEDSQNYPDSKDFFKIILENNKPIAVMAYGYYQGVVTVAEFFVAPEERSKGKGSLIIADLIENSNELIGLQINQYKVVIFPNNPASQRAFEKAGFEFESAHSDGDAWYYVYDNEL